MPPWLIFLLSAAVVAGAGIRLAQDGDTIAEGTGLGGMWVGAILVAAATSIPELTTDINAVLQGNPSLAVGDLFGSSMANMLILAVADLLTRRPRLLTRVAINQVLVGILGVFLTVVAAIGVLAGRSIGPIPLGWSTLVIGFGYFTGMRLLHRNRGEPPFRTPEEVEAARPRRVALRRAMVWFTVAAIVILIAAPYLAASTAEVADQLGISRGFAGLLFLACTTSLPEAAVTYASVRSGAYNLAVGNLLGSNCFNMAALIPLDLVHGRGAILADADPGLTVGALFGVLLMALAMLDVMNKSERRIWALEPGPAFMILAYLVGVYASYRLSGA
jgi:cation:H+ antiporter